MMMRRPGLRDLVGAGVAVGGTGVWGLAAAARWGALRLLLEQFPRASWDVLTWGLIPALLLLPPVLQGVVVAYLAAGRQARVGHAVVASIGGTMLAGSVFGVAFVLGARHLPAPVIAWLARTAPQLLIFGFIVLILAGWVLTAGLVFRVRVLSQAGLPVGVIGTALAWVLARGHVLALSYVLDRPEAEGFFASVVLGGAVASAWIVSWMHALELTGLESVGYNPPAPEGRTGEGPRWQETRARTRRHA